MMFFLNPILTSVKGENCLAFAEESVILVEISPLKLMDGVPGLCGKKMVF